MDHIKSFKSNKFFFFTTVLFTVLLVLVLIFANTNTNKKTASINSEILIGIWHECPYMASGWCDHYNFYQSGKYRLYKDQMDCAKTKTEESGTWGLDNNTLTLTTKEEIVLKGGQLIRASDSCSSKMELINATPEKLALGTPRIESYNLKFVEGSVKYGTETLLQEEIPYNGIYMNEKPYWRFSEDPTTYGVEDKFPEP